MKAKVNDKLNNMVRCVSFQRAVVSRATLTCSTSAFTILSASCVFIPVSFIHIQRFSFTFSGVLLALDYESWHRFDCPIACIILCFTSRFNRIVHFRALKLLRHWTIYLYLCSLLLFLLYLFYLTSEEGSIQQPKLVMLSFLWIVLYIDIRRSASFFTLCIFD